MPPEYPPQSEFISKVPVLNLSENREMLMEFTAEALKHLLTAKNATLMLDTVPDDRESIDSIFKSFHTIKGLADFLNLEDVRVLTQETETLLNMVRKKVVVLDYKITRLTSEAIDSLYRLIELLNEQVSNNGQLKSPYHSVEKLIKSLREVTSRSGEDIKNVSGDFQRDIPAISVEGEDDRAVVVKPSKSSGKSTGAKSEDFARVKAELDDTQRELQRAQGKLAERQREMIRERELAIRMTQQAQAVARSKSEYLASMAHEIRTLINAILGFANIIKKGQLTPKQIDQMETIIMSGNLLLGIVNHILDFSKVEAGKLQLEHIDFNLDGIVEDILRIIRTRLSRKPINLYYEFERNVPLQLRGDPTRLKQIFINLLENALKFTEKGEVSLLVSNGSPSKLEGKKNIQFTVQDTGIGLSEDRKNVIFESFTQAESSTSRIYGGSGLGLSLCKSYVEAMGGRIWVESQLGKGSKFIFEVPFDEQKTSASEQSSLPEFGTKTILIMDAHEKLRSLLKSMCEKLKFTVSHTFASVEELDHFIFSAKGKTTTPPDIIFIDIIPPGKTGLELAIRIRQESRYAQTKLIAVSCDVHVELVDKIYKLGFSDFLPKPYLLRELVGALQNTFGQCPEKEEKFSVEAIENASCEGMKVLVVEDSLPNQELLKAHFESLGCQVDYVANGQEAVEKLKINSYDICFMDLQMPVMGGVEATKVIRKDSEQKLPIIALTAAAIEEEKQGCLKAGMTDYLPKPFDLLELKEKLIRYVKKS